METKLIPYLNFAGNAAEAMKFYQSVLGGELKMTTFGESGMKDAPNPDGIMHASLENGALTFMASDAPMHKPVVGNNVQMSLVGTGKEQLWGFYEKLSEGGQVSVPLAEAPWGDTFGMFVDKFGIHWMVNISKS
jgi:PhnB protein